MGLQLMALRLLSSCHLLMAVAMAMAAAAAAAAAANSTEMDALLLFKAYVAEDPYDVFASWASSDASPCQWSGVLCDNTSAVISLSLPRKLLLGILPPELGNLHNLRHLNLHSNRLAGPLPPSLLDGAPSLQSVVLYGNAFNGTIPTQVALLPSLQSLDLSHNSFMGPIPTSLADSRRLTWLDLSSNLLTGSLPFGLGRLTLEPLHLNLSHNRLSGSIPDSGTLNLATLDLSANLLTGKIPSELASFPVNSFSNNPGLCGAPLVNASCPTTAVENSVIKRGLSTGSIVAIILSDVAALTAVSMLFFWFCRRQGGEPQLKKRSAVGNEESEWEPEGELVAVVAEKELGFGLEELLRASANVIGKNHAGIVYRVDVGGSPSLSGHGRRRRSLVVRRLGDGGEDRFKEFEADVQAIGKIQHPNIVRLWAYYWGIDEKLLVYDFIPNGSLSSALKGRYIVSSSPSLVWSSRMKIAKGVAKGLAYLHECGGGTWKHVHGEIKPSNILLDYNMEPYIKNYGLARLLSITGSGVFMDNFNDESFSSSLGSPGYAYLAPEIIKGEEKPTQKGDVFSFGMLLLELLTGKSPHLHLISSTKDLIQWVENMIEKGQSLPQILDPTLVDELDKSDEMIDVLKVALDCVSYSAEQRPSMKEVVDLLK